MIDELKILLDALASMPQLAIYVAFAFLFYKLAVTGSIVAALYKGFIKACEVISDIKSKPREVHTRYGDMIITGEEAAFKAQLQRICGKRTGISSTYIHRQSVEWLAEAIDAKEQDDAKNGKEG